MKWYERSYRRNLVDMHIEDWDERFLSQFDPQRYVSLLKEARVQSAMVYANSHIGHCYWPTKTGHQHRGLQGRDIFGEVLELCHREGMDVIAYYSVLYNNWAYEEHPPWRSVDIKGRAGREILGPRQRYGVCCPNNTEYRAFEEVQIKELCEGYEFGGIFFDMNFWSFICYCPDCKKRFAEEVGGELPTVIDWGDSKWRRCQEKREQWLAEHALFVSQVAKKYQPGVSTEHNSASFTSPPKRGATLRLLEANDYIGGDLYGGLLEQSFICKLYYSITPNLPFEYMTSRCYPSAHDHTTTKSKEMLALRNFLTLGHNGAFLFIDAINPDGTQDGRIYSMMGDIFEQSAPYEKYLGGQLCMDVAVYFSLNAKMDFAETGIKIVELVETDISQSPHLNAALGVVRTLKEHHIPFGVISKNRIGRLSEHRVLVLPDVLVLDAQEQQAIREYVQNGGAVYASGHSGGFLSDVCGVVHEGELKEAVSYIVPRTSADELMLDIDPESPPCIGASLSCVPRGYDRQVKARACDQDKVIATVVLPYTDPADLVKIASIHTDPPGVPTDFPAVVDHSFGKGRVLWVSAPLEKPNTDVHKNAFIAMIQHLGERKFTFEVQAPPAVEVIVFHQPDRKRYLINVVNEQELLPPVPASGVKVTLQIPGKRFKKAMLLPEEKTLPVEAGPDAVTVEIPTVELFRMLSVDYQ